MDRDIEDLSGTLPTRTLWPGLWVPLVILLVGTTLTVIGGRWLGQSVQHYALQQYQAQHMALVNALGHYLRSEAQPVSQQQLSAFVNHHLPEYVTLRIDTLTRHTKQPILELGSTLQPLPQQTLRTEVITPTDPWMVATTPDALILESPARQSRRIFQSIGLFFTGLATALALMLCRQVHLRRQASQTLASNLAQADRRLSNLNVEKSTLRQALTDSETRSRDLLRLAGALIAELDEEARIGFISSQVADVLDYAPSDLVGEPFATLVDTPDRARFQECLTAARRDHETTRADLALVARDQIRRVPVVLRLMVLREVVHGLTGFRLSAVPATPAAAAGQPGAPTSPAP
ncbi:MAG TPA: PAS domain-containing protein [Marinobacter sp.]|nr:PAS domain-containing protein [Marinobacter sp.]